MVRNTEKIAVTVVSPKWKRFLHCIDFSMHCCIAKLTQVLCFNYSLSEIKKTRNSLMTGFTYNCELTIVWLAFAIVQKVFHTFF